MTEPLDKVALRSQRLSTSQYEEEVVGLAPDKNNKGIWNIYVLEIINGQPGLVSEMKYKLYKKVSPEKIIDFFEKHLDFIKPEQTSTASPNSVAGDSDKENKELH